VTAAAERIERVELVDVHGVPCVPVVKIGERVIYALQPKQYQFYQLTPLWLGRKAPEHIGYGGSAGSAKSHSARAIATAVAMAWPGSSGIIFRRTEDEVNKNHLVKFKEEIPRSVTIDGVKTPISSWNGKDRCLTWFNGSRTYLGYLRHDDDVFRYQGPEFDFMCFEEATHYTFFQVSWLVNNRLRASVDGARPFAIYPSNPGNRGHFWYKRWFIDRNFREAEEPSKFAFLQAFLADNQILMKRDPAYAPKLDRLEEPWRSWLRDGDFAAGAGSALPELARRVHLIEPFKIPAHWSRFGAFDWGYDHPWSFGEYAVNEDGWVFKLDTITGRRQLPDQIAARIMNRVDVAPLRYVAAGHDALHHHKARGENTPSIAEQMGPIGKKMILANVDRIAGLNNMRAYTSWKHRGPAGGVGEPRFYLFDTPGNRKCFDQLENMVTDPDDPEDVLKVDADDYGEGGDDHYDETRYGLASRPIAAAGLAPKGQTRAFAPETLAYEEKMGRARPDQGALPHGQSSRGTPANRRPLHPEFGGMF
jgi:phage terminase large subunit